MTKIGEKLNLTWQQDGYLILSLAVILLIGVLVVFLLTLNASVLLFSIVPLFLIVIIIAGLRN